MNPDVTSASDPDSWRDSTMILLADRDPEEDDEKTMAVNIQDDQGTVQFTMPAAKPRPEAH
jgi:hypothetical protein